MAERFTPKSFWNSRPDGPYAKYKEYRDKLTPALQELYDREVEPECDCDWGTPHCPHMGRSPEQVYERISAIVNAAAKDLSNDDW